MIKKISSKLSCPYAFASFFDFHLFLCSSTDVCRLLLSLRFSYVSLAQRVISEFDRLKSFEPSVN